jgi:hypothetical protein
MLVEFSGSQREREQTQLMRLAKSVAGGKQRDLTTITCRTCKRGIVFYHKENQEAAFLSSI